MLKRSVKKGLEFMDESWVLIYPIEDGVQTERVVPAAWAVLLLDALIEANAISEDSLREEVIRLLTELNEGRSEEE